MWARLGIWHGRGVKVGSWRNKRHDLEGGGMRVRAAPRRDARRGAPCRMKSRPALPVGDGIAPWIACQSVLHRLTL